MIARIAQSLAPGGFLFLGHAETLRGISDAFHLRHTHETFYYQRKEHVPAFCVGADPRRRQRVCRRRAGRGVEHRMGRHDPRSERARRGAGSGGQCCRCRRARPEPPAWDLAPAFDFLRHERFAEALDHVRSGPPRCDGDPDVLLLKAMLLAHSGQLDAADDVCRRLLLIDELNAGAHYVLALCREHAGQMERAAEHDRVAAYLDPAFAMPRLHLGLLARRAGDRDRARRDLAQALFLLKREDAARLLLFGGGFDRAALIALCELALADCGGRP